MMDTQRIGSGERVFVLTKAGNKLLDLKPGEVIQAKVVDVRPSGEVSLSVRGKRIEARTTLQLPKGAGVLLRVLGQKTVGSGPEIRLQFLGITPEPEAAGLSSDADLSGLKALTQELADNLSAAGKRPEFLATTVERLLKALPEDPAVLPKALRDHLLDLLRSSLRNAGQSIQERTAHMLKAPLLQELPEGLALVRAVVDSFADLDGVLRLLLKSALENTGVGLEARVRLLAQGLEGDRLSSEGAASPSEQRPETALLQMDLKARLLQLRQALLDRKTLASNGAMPSQTAGGQTGAGGGNAVDVLGMVDGLLRDIETFQLLSRLTDSFYTFLPVLWKGLRKAEIALKRGGSAPHGGAVYCLMHLDFEELGELTVVTMMQHRDFFVSFKATHDGLRSVLNSHAHELHQMFADQGLSLKGVNFFDGREQHLGTFERLESFENLINLKV